MLDMGFLPDIQRIINLLPPVRQNLMFSATFSGEIRKLAETFLKNPISIEVARRNAAADNVEQLVYKVADTESKRLAVTQLVRERQLSQVIVFTNTKIGAGRLARQLERDGLNASAIHGDKSQQERLATLEAFKKGEVAILVATDVAARGLDIAELPAVINYDLPYSPEDYIHRIGRTGRAGASGVALSLMTGSDERLLDGIQKLLKRELPLQVLVVAGAAPERSTEGERGAGRSEGRSAREPRQARPPRAADPREAREPREAPPPREAREPREAVESDDTASPRDAREKRDLREARESREPRRRDVRSGSYTARAPLAGHSNDPFFYKPYEPPAQVAGAAPAEQPVGPGALARRKQAARPVAALLGGKKG